MDPDTISKMRYGKIRPVCLTISTKDKIRRPEKVSEKDLRKTAMIIGRDLRTNFDRPGSICPTDPGMRSKRKKLKSRPGPNGP